MNDLKKINDKLDLILSEKKKPLNVKEACSYLGITKPTLYKLTSSRILPYYKPNGQLIYFDIGDLEKFVYSNKVESISNIKNNK